MVSFLFLSILTQSIQDPKPKTGLSFKRLFVDYSKWCTVVCLKNIVTSPKWLAIIYAIVFIAMYVRPKFSVNNAYLKVWPVHLHLNQSHHQILQVSVIDGALDRCEIAGFKL